MERKLAVILAADVVGYSALMEADEAGTLERLKAGRLELFEPEIARHHGRIFKVMGDGMLAEFGSVVDAVECAAALQRGLAERNAAVSENQRTQVRIGINLGEVIVEGEDRYGEGVNIAARLQQLADPGGICVSGKVAKEVEKKLAFGFEPMGERKVKNIAEPIAVFRIRLDGLPARRRSQLPSRRAWPWVAAIVVVLLAAAGVWYASLAPEPEADVAQDPAATDTGPSLVVLPLANLSDDREQGYLADGITEDLTTELARVPGLFVISRNAAFTYKGKAMLPAEIARDLGVSYILEGSTRRTGDEMRINVQLIDARSGGHLWAERFDGSWADVFALQDRVVKRVADSLHLRMVAGEGKASVAGGTSNPAAYEAYLRGLELELRYTPAETVEAVIFLERALAIDPNFGRAAAELAWVYWNVDEARRQALGLSWQETNARRDEFLAIAANHPSPTYYQIKAQLLTRQRRSDEAIAALQAAVALDPSDPWTFDGLAEALIFNGRPNAARVHLGTAMRLNPSGLGDSLHWRQYLAGLAAFGEERFEDAVRSLEQIDLRSADSWTKFNGLQVLVSAFGHLGHRADAEAALAELRTVLEDMDEPEYDLLLVQRNFVFKNEADIVRLLDGLTKVGIRELPSDIDPQSEHRLTMEEMKSLLFGHELQGRRTAPEVLEYGRITALDGSATVIIGSETRQGLSWTQAGVFCVAFPRQLTSCGVIFRNPSGTLEDKNEYQFIFYDTRYVFSVVR